ncbi:MAG: SDR family oxidoreductase [Actinomycetes bacterium]
MEPTPCVLITGGAGLVAGHLVRSAPERALVHTTWRSAAPEHTAISHRVELTDPDEVSAVAAAIRPNVIIHTAYSQSVRADVETATAHVADAAAMVGAKLVHLSTDMVFGGDDAPYDEDATPNPLNEYGRWKVAAERYVQATVADAVITRSSLVVSTNPADHQTRWLVSALRDGRRVTLFHDEYRTPVRAEDLAADLWTLALGDVTGVVHLPGPERLSRAELGVRVARQCGCDSGLIDFASAADHPEPRPRDLTLATVRHHVRVAAPRPVAT